MRGRHNTQYAHVVVILCVKYYVFLAEFLFGENWVAKGWIVQFSPWNLSDMCIIKLRFI